MTHHTNSLIHESSPYLLQHAHNPVDWQPWGQAAFKKAEKEEKLVIISIGYSSCHWCHVMEHETFEDPAAAALMNEHFISIKVDREERPDVDQVYMTAVQLMTGRGGWPMNVVALPDGRPVWGGTYFPRENWMQALNAIWKMYRENPEKVLEYAEKLTEGVKVSELVESRPGEAEFLKADADSMIAGWKGSFDHEEGGNNYSPKFPMPVSYEFLLQYGHLSGDQGSLQHLQLTLDKMAVGGIYDQAGGGFARYSTDKLWKAPHFEKMLYDNAQLVSLYSHAYQKFKDPLYANVVFETLEFLQREMTGENGEFYSALDADSEGEEGAFYVWTEKELKEVIPEEDWPGFTEYYDLAKGKWEGKIILVRRSKEASAKAEKWNRLLLKQRSKRTRPGLDDKALTSWNALMISGLVDASQAAFPGATEKAGKLSPFPGGARDGYLSLALKNANWILKNQSKKDGSLWHSHRNGKSSIDGLIEDYAFAGQAFLDLFEVTFDEKYLHQAEKWVNYAQQNFEDSATGLFYTRSLHSEQLIARSMETSDNVIPASNSVMAHNLFRLSLYLDKPGYRKQAEKMLHQITEQMLNRGESYANWGQLLLNLTYPHYEVAVAGKEAKARLQELNTHYIPNAIFIGTEKGSDLPLLENRFVEGATLIYVCQDKACKLPVEKVEKALKEMENG